MTEARNQDEPCCKGNPVSGYVSKGKETTLGDMKVYVTGPEKDAKIAIIVSYDIFGFEMGGTRRVCDNLADSLKAVVVFGDYFRGKPWDESNFPPKEGFESFLGWAKSFTDEFLLNEFTTLTEHIKKEKTTVTKIGLLGFCFGGHPTFLAAKTGNYDAAVTCHGAFIEESEGADLKCPVLMIDAGDDPKRPQIQEDVGKKDFGPKCQFHRFEDMKHGWVNRGDVNDSAVKPRMDEAFALIVKFFQGTLN